MEQYIEKNGKKMYYGYTTGSCASAAAKAATLELFGGEGCDYMTIDTPKGWELIIEVSYLHKASNSVTCSVVKDGGDDPDVTHGIKIFATVIKSEIPGIVIEGGIGVGRVTKKGLRVPIGDAAINPVPLKMIHQEVSKVLPKGEGVTIIIFVPEGEAVAKRTFNAKLGIMGGISILGTTGIVEPMSEDAFRESLKLELSVKAATGIADIIFIFGNFGRDYLDDDALEAHSQKTSNFVRYMLEAAVQLGIKRVLYIGHAGKMVKVASGMDNTHSKYGDNRMTSIVSCAKVAWLKSHGAQWTDTKTKDLLLEANTTDEAVEILTSCGLMEATFESVAYRCKEVCESMVKGQLEVECVVFSSIHGQLGATKEASKLRAEISGGYKR